MRNGRYSSLGATAPLSSLYPFRQNSCGMCEGPYDFVQQFLRHLCCVCVHHDGRTSNKVPIWVLKKTAPLTRAVPEIIDYIYSWCALQGAHDWPQFDDTSQGADMLSYEHMCFVRRPNHMPFTNWPMNYMFEAPDMCIVRKIVRLPMIQACPLLDTVVTILALQIERGRCLLWGASGYHLIQGLSRNSRAWHHVTTTQEWTIHPNSLPAVVVFTTQSSLKSGSAANLPNFMFIARALPAWSL